MERQPCHNGALIFIEGIYATDSSTPAHTHRQASLCFVLQGTHTVICRKVAHVVEPGTLVFLPVEELHRCIFPMEAKVFQVFLEAPWIAQLHPHPTALDHPGYYSAGALTQLAVRAYEEFRGNDVFSPLALEGLVLEMLAGIARNNIDAVGPRERRPPLWLREVHDLLHERFAESLSLDEIAQAVGVHPAHLGRMFRRYYRGTIGEYLRDLRVQCACHRLSTSADPLVEIALSCGYADQSHFAATFKRYTGWTPKEYRRIFHAR